MNRSQLRISCVLRLGSPLCIPHTCVCGTRGDQSGVHGLSCRKSAGRSSRHAQVNDIIKRALSSAHIPSILEPNGVSRSDGKRPDGMTIYPWKNGRIMVWDFTCSDTIAPSHIQIASAISGKVAENAETAKLTKYRNLSADYEVIPIGVETFGSWGPNGLRLMRDREKNSSRNRRTAVNLPPNPSYKYGHSERKCFQCARYSRKFKKIRRNLLFLIITNNFVYF